MTAATAVNAGLQELQQGEREKRIFRMDVLKAKFVFTLFVLIFSIADIILPLVASNYYYFDSHNYIDIYIGAPISVIIGFVWLLTPRPSMAICYTYLICQVGSATLIVIANIVYMANYASTGEIIGSIIINVCYLILLVLNIQVVLLVIRLRKAEKRLARDGREIRVITQGAAFPAQAPPRPPQPVVPVTVVPPTSGAPGGPVTTTTVITTYNAAPGQPVIIPPGIPAVHGIPPGPLNPATLANNQVYARTTSNMYPTVPQVQQMATPTPVVVTSIATAPASASMLPSAPAQLYDFPPEVTVATVYHQNKANDEEQYDMPPALAEDQEESIHGGSESPSPSDFSEVPSSSHQYYEAPPEEQSSFKESPSPVPRKTRPNESNDAPNIDKYEAPPSEEEETPIFL